VAPRPITFLTDYGIRDEFAGVCRAVIAGIAPDATVIDLTHVVDRHDIGHGAAALAAAVPFAPPGVHLAVVDPGVGTERRAVAIRAATDERMFVGPDNGLLMSAVERLGGAVEAVDISATPVRLEPVSATFHGRDLFAPVAAHLALGAPLGDLGEPFDAQTLVKLERPAAAVEPGRLTTSVVRVDGFGNAGLTATADDGAVAGLAIGSQLVVSAPDGEHHAVHAVTFADAGEGGLVLYINALGNLGLAVNRGSAAEQLGLEPGDELVLRPA
jgi:S-adenosylmethionine hydrolase